MPIYAYKCESCGHAKDVLQKMSDAALVDCPACGAPSFKKQLTAAGFQLKGSGWYVTDFRDGKGGAKEPGTSGEKTKDGEKSKDSGSPEKADTSSSSGSDKASLTTKAPAAAPAPATAPLSPAPVPKATP